MLGQLCDRWLADTGALSLVRGLAPPPLGRVQRLQDSGDRIVHWRVLPNAEDMPAGRCERRRRDAVPLNVAIELLGPVRRVVAWVDAMIRAPVPEAAVEEHGYAGASEGDVCAGCCANAFDAIVDAVPAPRTMQCRPKAELRPGVAAAVAAHDGAYSGRLRRPGPE
jgi:hypothetical protein